MRALIHAAVLLLVAAATVPSARAEAAWTAEDTLMALQGSPYMVRCIVERETGWTYDPYALGAAGEQGVAQLLPAANGGGQWDEFFYGDWTRVDPSARSTWNPYQAVWFLTVYGSEHGYGAWTTSRYC